MTRKEEINNAKTAFYETVLEDDYYYDPRDCFEEGAKWSDKHPKLSWISVKDDLPCYHKELIDPRESLLQTVLVIVWDGFSAKMDYMYYENKEWKWCHNKLVIYWMPIPEPSKELEAEL